MTRSANDLLRTAASGMAAALLSSSACGPAGSGEPEPDPAELEISGTRLETTAAVEWVHLAPDTCTVADGCVEGEGWRRLVRADIEIRNVGAGALDLGAPEDGAPFFEPDACRGESTLRLAPELSLYDAEGQRVRSVRARTGCWYDGHRFDHGAGAAAFTSEACDASQGISPGWSHLSTRDTACQAIDVTDLPAGTYRLRVEVDPDGLLESGDRERMSAQTPIVLSPTGLDPVCAEQSCYLPGDTDCGRLTCSPEPAVRVCDGTRVVEVSQPGICHPAARLCVVEREEIVDCADTGAICHEGACSDLCGAVDCGETAWVCADEETALRIEPGACDPGSGTCGPETVHEIPCGASESCLDGVCVPETGLPDLTVRATRLTHSHFVEWTYFEEDACALEHACIGAAGWRRLMRFTTVIENQGTAPAFIGEPATNPDFVWDECRRQYQWQNDTRHDLLSTDGSVVATTHKKSFCLYDVHPIPEWPDPPEAEHPASEDTCRENQGITHGWVDVYHHSLHCQWVDVTGIPAGDYILRVTVNTERLIDELDYTNNTVEAPVVIPPTDGPPDDI